MSDAGRTATKELLETHQRLVTFYDTEVATSPQPAYQLRAEHRSQLPKSLRTEVVFGTELVGTPVEGDEFRRTYTLRRMVGFGSGAFSSTIYAARDIKNALIASHAGRCAYCESYLRHVDHGDVEHFRPKAGVVEMSREGLNRDAYFWLAYEPSNLFLACKICNEVNKGNWFPVLGPRLAPGNFDVGSEAPVLIDPYREDPRDHIRFDPLTGKAYPFDLLSAAAGSKEVAEQTVWAQPALIEHETASAVEKLRALSAEEQGLLGRGHRTITLLHLNRPSLVRARIAHLRHLRALLWASYHPSAAPDPSRARELLGQLRNDRGLVSLAPEYHSLTIDAVSTWALREAHNIEPFVPQHEPATIDQKVVTEPWLEMYDEFLFGFAHEGAEDEAADPSTYNDALSFFVPITETAESRYRRLVYLTDEEKLYGVAEDASDGYYLAVDWDEYGNREVTRQQGSETVQKLRLAEFLTVDTKQLWRKFDRTEVVVEGPFPPLDG